MHGSSENRSERDPAHNAGQLAGSKGEAITQANGGSLQPIAAAKSLPAIQLPAAIFATQEIRVVAYPSPNDQRLRETYSSYLMWCKRWDYRTPPSYSEWLKLSSSSLAQGAGAGNVISWKGTQ